MRRSWKGRCRVGSSIVPVCRLRFVKIALGALRFFSFLDLQIGNAGLGGVVTDVVEEGTTQLGDVAVSQIKSGKEWEFFITWIDGLFAEPCK